MKAFVISDSSLIRSLRIIFKTCLKLLINISSSFKTYSAKIEHDFKVYNEELSEKSCIEIILNRHHLELRTFSCISLKYTKKQCNFSIHSKKLIQTFNLQSHFVKLSLEIIKCTICFNLIMLLFNDVKKSASLTSIFLIYLHRNLNNVNWLLIV